MQEVEKGTPLILAGPSGSGKSAVIGLLLRTSSSFRLSVSDTTRPPRKGAQPERDGVEYNFITNEEFERRIDCGAYLEYDRHFDVYYGTPAVATLDMLKQGITVIFDIDVNGAERLRRVLPSAVGVALLPPSYDELHRRLIERGTSDEIDLSKRLARAARELPRLRTEFKYTVCNHRDKARQAADDILRILAAQGGEPPTDLLTANNDALYADFYGRSSS